MNPNAPVLKPSFAPKAPSSPEKLSPVKALPTISNPTNSISALAADPMNGYVNKFASAKSQQ